MTPANESRLRRLLGFVFGAALASATVAAVSALVPLPGLWGFPVATAGAAIGATFASLIGAYALGWRSQALAVAIGTAVGTVPASVPAGTNLVVACWVSSAVASLAVARHRFAAPATPPGLVAAIHFLQLPLIAFPLAVSLVSPRPRPFVVALALSAFALWRLLDGDCPLARAEYALRTRRGEQPFRLGELGFIAYHVQRTTGLLLPKGAAIVFAYVLAALVFTWYGLQALRGAS